MLLYQLPDDILYLVLYYLDCKSLSRLSQVCKKIHTFVNRDAVWRSIARECINTGMTRQGTDMYPQIPLKDRVRVSQNWRRGHHRKEVLLKWKTNLLPWIQLDRDVLYLSQAADIGAYHLRVEGGRIRRPAAVYSGHREDVCRFVLTDTHLISAGGDGKIIAHHRWGRQWVEFSGHGQEVNCVDSQGGVIVSGSRDRTARVWTLSSEQLGGCLYTIPMLDRVWSVAISPSQSSFVTGTACCENPTPLRIWDTERSCVMQWEEPHDCALYCIQSDGNHMIASGSSYYGVVRLWDKRHTRCLQSFQLSPSTSSPVYCLRFNTSHLYTALATALFALDFRGHVTKVRR
ncbi:F-box/WD repeat-containing protein 4 isoform X2 [Brienomyrus brachyistius]|uniref:F-box/WD repeat-containing protein 4 isoform X2 n=1 Tax=Brienomyrus brachyistius TaxID=42636 RepID=UPI0020B217D7|nr:F-box/WD repeat-containing protein 4 isoform X2 [Brienomyrus brachyistius]